MQNYNIKSLIAVAIAVLVVVLSPHASLYAQQGKAPTLRQLFTEGVTAYNGKDWDGAERRFRQVLKAQPGNVYARRYLARIEEGRRKQAAIPPLKKRLSTVVIPEVDFEELTLAEAMEFVRIKSKQIGGIEPGIMIKPRNPPTSPPVRERIITIKAKAIPVDHLLSLIERLASVRFEYQKYAIVGISTSIEPAPKPASASAEKRRTAVGLKGAPE